MGFDSDTMTGHGFRAMARTILDEVLGFRPDFIEHQLAHAVRDPNGRAYNRTAHLAERKKMMQAWADYLDALRTNANVVRSEEHTSELQTLMRISYAVFCLKKKTNTKKNHSSHTQHGILTLLYS